MLGNWSRKLRAPAVGRNRRKATVKIWRNAHLEDFVTKVTIPLYCFRLLETKLENLGSIILKIFLLTTILLQTESMYFWDTAKLLFNLITCHAVFVLIHKTSSSSVIVTITSQCQDFFFIYYLGNLEHHPLVMRDAVL